MYGYDNDLIFAFPCTIGGILMFSTLDALQDACSVYERSASLRHMISRVRRDPAAFARYQHNRDLVSLVNQFADIERDLPRGWEAKYDRSGKVCMCVTAGVINNLLSPFSYG